jgi:hypothetical protein
MRSLRQLPKVTEPQRPLANRAPAPAVYGFRQCEAHWNVAMVSDHTFHGFLLADDNNGHNGHIGHNHNPSLNDDRHRSHVD